MKLVRRTLVLLSVLASSAVAQSDARWQAWLGCWTADSVRAAAATSVCVVPVAKSNAVELLTVARGAIVIRERIEANGRPLPISGNGCQGTETANWSASGRRLYLHADFSCANRTPGTTTTVFAMMPTGEWLRVEKARSGGGSVVTATRLRPTTLPAALTETAARAIESQQRAVVVARASAAAPIAVEEIVDAVHNLDGEVVRAWLIASQQRFDFDATQVAALADAGVPSPILETVAPRLVEAPATVTRVVAPVVAEEPEPEMTTMRRCAANGCGRENRYSDYNGVDWGPVSPYPYNYYGYPYPYLYPYTAFVPFSSFVNTHSRNNPRSGFRDRPKGDIRDRPKATTPGRPRQVDPPARTRPTTRAVAPAPRRR